MADIEFGEQVTDPAPQGVGSTLQTLVNWAGALTSVALVGGLAYWGYSLAVRDVTGVPVVRALEGPMRVAPENPGGDRAQHQGLAVNSVAAAGEAEAPADRLVLAPQPQTLSEEDQPAAALPEIAAVDPAARPAKPVQQPVTAPPAAAAAPITAPDPVSAALALADQVSAGATPMAQDPGAAEAVATDATASTAVARPTGPKIIDAAVPGVRRSPRPGTRPADLASRPRNIQPVAATPASADIEVAARDLVAGTNMVQLGAYDSAKVARAEWQRLSGRFGTLMEGKQRLVQSAKSGGRTFYRLRAVGFADISDARRFCAALTAEKAGCIPVVWR